MRKRLKVQNQIAAVIPTASMADIAFLLTIFFMVTTVFQVDKTSVKLPQSEIREEVKRGSAFIVLHQPNPGSEDVEYKFSNGEENSRDVAGIEGLYAEVANMTAVSPYYHFVLKADSTLNYAKVDEVIQILQQAKATFVVLLTAEEPRKVKP